MSTDGSEPVYNVKEFGDPDAAKVVFFFCPFGILSWHLALPGMPIWRLRRYGFRVVSYSYKTGIYRSNIATTSLQLTIDNIAAMIHDADQRVEHMDPRTKVSCFGASMGTVMAANVAARHDRIQKVILNLSYADISDHIVNLPNIRAISSKKLQRYLATAGNEHDLREAFNPYSPLALVEKFKGKKLLVYASKDDHILQLAHTSKFHAALRAARVDFYLYENHRGRHYFAALVNYLRYRRWLAFLNS